MSKKTHINLTVDSSILNWIDTLRGQEPRSTFINHILSIICGKAKKAFNWEEEEKKAEQDIKKGRVHKFSTAEDAIKWLKR